MDDANKTALRCCRFLTKDDFPRLYEAFLEAFSDYVISFALTEEQFRNHILLNAVDIDRSVGCEQGNRLVGFSLNGFGIWQGKQTVYDAGTGVVPACRRQGVSREMFRMMMPRQAESGVEQFLLEVITTNTGALKLYEELGFQRGRELALLQCDQRGENFMRRVTTDVDVRDIEDPNWAELVKFWDGHPSWQNSIEAVERTRAGKRIVGAYVDGKCVGYIVFSSTFGRVAQLAVAEEHRGLGIGTALVAAMRDATASGFSLQVINIDRNLTAAVNLFKSLGFYERVRQYEMIRPM